MAKPRESPTNAGFTTPKSRYQVGIASLWPLATASGTESLYLCMKKTSYEYEMGWGSQSYVTVEPHGKTKRISYQCWFYLFHKQISGWDCILMTTSHSSRYGKSLQMYEEDLLWVWSGLGFSIICNSRTPWQNQNQENHLLPPLPDCETQHISGWSCILMTTDHSSRRCWNTLYCKKKICYEYEGDVECLDHNIQHDKVNSYFYLTVVNPIIYLLGLHPYDH